MANVVGVNFSNTFQSQKIPGTTAAQQINGLGVSRVKMFNYTQTDFLGALSSNSLKAAVAVPNDELATLNDGTTSGVTNAIEPYKDVIETICVGNEPLGSWQPPAYKGQLAGAVTNLTRAVASKGWNINVTVPFNYSIMQTSWPPSAGAFQSGLTSILESVCAQLKQSKSPFMINVYPFLDHANNPKDVPLDYCLFTNTTPQFTDPAWHLPYYNIFDAAYDALWQALNAINYGDLKIVVGECGWPAWPTGVTPPAPYGDATISNAQTFNQNLINHCNSGQGTPKNPNIQIPTYIFEMYDEDQKSTDPGPFEVYWGIFTDDNAAGTAKYPLTF